MTDQNKFFMNLLKRGYDINEINKLWAEVSAVPKGKKPERSEGRSASARLPAKQSTVRAQVLTARQPARQKRTSNWSEFLKAHKGELNNYSSMGEYTKAMSALYHEEKDTVKPTRAVKQPAKARGRPAKQQTQQPEDDDEAPSGYMLNDEGEIVEFTQ